MAVAAPYAAASSPYTLTDGNARLDVQFSARPDTTWSDGLVTSSLTVDGDASRVANDLYAWSLPSARVAQSQQTAANRVETLYGGLSWWYSFAYELTGGAPNSGEATIQETITLGNSFMYGALTLPLYGFADYNLSSQDQATMLAPDTLLQRGKDSSLLVTSTIAPSHFEIGDPDALLAKIETQPNTNLSDSPGLGAAFPSAPGNAAYGLQWNVNVDRGLSRSFTVTKRISTMHASTVPEPGSLALMVAGLLPALGLARRRARR
jgi:hypothetical protein